MRGECGCVCGCVWMRGECGCVCIYIWCVHVCVHVTVMADAMVMSQKSAWVCTHAIDGIEINRPPWREVVA